MEAFLAEVQMMLPVLGFDFTRRKPTVASAKSPCDLSPVFVLKRVGIVAEAQEIEGEFVVLAGSTMRREVKASGEAQVPRHKQMLADGLLLDSDDPTTWRFREDAPFSSPSAAASMLMGSSINGRKHWKIKATGQTYAQWQDAKLAGADAFDAADHVDDDVPVVSDSVALRRGLPEHLHGKEGVLDRLCGGLGGPRTHVVESSHQTL